MGCFILFKSYRNHIGYETERSTLRIGVLLICVEDMLM